MNVEYWEGKVDIYISNLIKGELNETISTKGCMERNSKNRKGDVRNEDKKKSTKK